MAVFKRSRQLAAVLAAAATLALVVAGAATARPASAADLPTSHGAMSAARAGGGQLSTLGPASIPNIDQVDCFARTDFFEVWYGSGLNEICFANAGTVNLDIRGVWFIRTGNNGGRMKFGQNLVFIDQIFGKFQNLDFSKNPIELFQVKIT